MPGPDGRKTQSSLLSFFGRKAGVSPSPRQTDPPTGPNSTDDGPVSLDSVNAMTPASSDAREKAVEPLSSPPAPRGRLAAIDSSDSSDASSDEDFVQNDSGDEADTVMLDDRAPHPLRAKRSASSRGAGENSHSAREQDALAKFASSSSYVPLPRSDDAPAWSPAKKPKFTGCDEERYQWLEDVRDADGNRPGASDYDPRTILVPASAWAKFTPFEKQYWEIKSKMWNTVVFFKKGKFYELYENDAAIAHAEFDLKLAGGGRANMSLCGVPEMSFDYWASAFIAKGYKVAKVDQMETALAKEMRDSSVGKKEEKVLKRKLSCVLTAGTLTDETMLTDELSQYCMAIKQQGLHLAIAFVDTATSTFHLSEFDDGSSYHMFETLIAQTRPREVVCERGNLDRALVRIIKNNTSVDTLWEVLKPETEFWDAHTTLQQLAHGRYFDAEDLDDTSRYPEALQKAMQSETLLSAFGGLLWYLRNLKLDRQIVSLGNFTEYCAVQQASHLVLNGQTLQNLEIFANSWDQGAQGTLFKLVNKCVTPFGKRKLHSWVAHPLRHISAIRARQDAVEVLIDFDELREHVKNKLAGLPDIERMLSRIHAGMLQPKDFVRVVAGIEQLAKLLAWLGEQNLNSALIDSIAQKVPNARELIAPWMTAFDHAQAQTANVLTPEPGVEPEFDQSTEKMKQIEAELETQLRTYQKELRSLAVCYRDSGKEIYLIEVPSKIKQVPSSWQQMGSTSKVKRFYSPEVKQLVRTLQETRETHKLIKDSVQCKLYKMFSRNYYAWLDLVRAAATLDCLLSLAQCSLGMVVGCRPTFVDGERAFLSFRELRHPCVQNDSFIPNDVCLGGNKPRMTLLTGANAAGKSTILRMTGIAVVLAQIGCHVPAAEATLVPMDRVMTRLGASDNIFAGKSTFHVELSETERILSESTPHTLVLIDELGRGGSSSDGFAIAEAVLHHLATHIACLGFFATHYRTLMNSFCSHPEVRAQRMSSIVDKESRLVTFTYKLEDGLSEGSFGMNVARMCGVDANIVAAAETAAREHEHTQRLERIGFQLVPLGLQSDAVWCLKSNFNNYAIEAMIESSK